MAGRALWQLGELRPALRRRDRAVVARAAAVPRGGAVARLRAASRRGRRGAMIWAWILVAAGLTVGGLFWLGRLPAASRPLAAAAIMLGLAGYALQGNPALPGKPVVRSEPESFGEALTDTRQGMADRFGPAAKWLAMSDGFARTGKTELAAQTLEKGLESKIGRAHV